MKESNPFIENLLKRFPAIQGIFVTDSQGNLVTKFLLDGDKVVVEDENASEPLDFEQDGEYEETEDDSQRSELMDVFDSSLCASFLLANEQSNKLPYGKNKYLVSFFEDYSLVQYCKYLNVANPPKEVDENDNEYGFRNSLEQEQECNAYLITIISDKRESTQLLKDYAPVVLDALIEDY